MLFGRLSRKSKSLRCACRISGNAHDKNLVYAILTWVKSGLPFADVTIGLSETSSEFTASDVKCAFRKFNNASLTDTELCVYLIFSKLPTLFVPLGIRI